MTIAQKHVCLGNEAIARGLVESGCHFVAAYPGTPSSEIIPAVARFKRENNLDTYIEWSVNEKVALENALVASYTGKRAAAVMKQVGLNVAADPLMSAAYIGVIGGFLVISCDDPGPHSSQTEQDSRFMAMFAKIPVFDPANPEEARAMIPLAFELSEKFQLPVILRPVTRVSHARQTIAFQPIPNLERRADFPRNPPRWSAPPRQRLFLHGELNKKIKDIEAYFHQLPTINYIEHDCERASLGIIAAGICHAMVQDTLTELDLAGKIPVLKIGTPYPLPLELVEAFLAKCDEVLILEETEPVIEYQIRDKTKVTGRLDGAVPGAGEMLPDLVARILVRLCRKHSLPFKEDTAPLDFEQMLARLGLPFRRPSLCPGCAHRAAFYIMKKTFPQAIFPSDIGCYTLGMNMDTVDTCHNMGAAITFASGLFHAYHQDKADIPIIATIGDSTFYHSGPAGLLNAVYNGARFVLVILDNSITAMTGMQPTPESGITADGHPGKQLSLEELVRGCGVEYLKVVNPYDMEAMAREVKRAREYTRPPEGGVAVLIARYPCITQKKEQLKITPVKVDIRHVSPGGQGRPALAVGERPAGYLPVYRDKIAPCTAACPLEVDARGYLTLLARGEFAAALSLIREKNPFPWITGRLCARPCEKACRRGRVDEPVAINCAKRFLAEGELLPVFEPKPGPDKKEKVAIVGSGPTGLMAAVSLRLLGYGVAIFEALPVAGGTLAVSCGRFRLPQEVLEREISLVERLGAEFKFNVRIGADLTLDDLFRKGYGAILLAPGAHEAREISLACAEAAGVMDVLSFLRKLALQEALPGFSRVVVLGRDERAIDAARSALRLGAREVTVLANRTRSRLPASDRDISEAQEEGINILFKAEPSRIITADGKVTAVAYRQAGGPDIGGPEKKEERVAADFVLISPDYVPALDSFPGTIERTEAGNIRVNPATLMTATGGVFAGGDAVSGPGNFIENLAAGKKAALSIHCFLRGEELPMPQKAGLKDRVGRARIDDVESKPRVKEAGTNVSACRDNFEEVPLLPREEEVVAEAGRCLHCGACNHCDICLIQCPLGAITKKDGNYEIDQAKCSGCRLCVRECPTTALEMPAAGACMACGYCLKRFECPSLIKSEDGPMEINRLTCVDCGLCLQVCGHGAIYRVNQEGA